MAYKHLPVYQQPKEGAGGQNYTKNLCIWFGKMTLWEWKCQPNFAFEPGKVNDALARCTVTE